MKLNSWQCGVLLKIIVVITLAGVDRVSKLATELKLDGKFQGIKCVIIPKSGTNAKRLLEIPTIDNRAKQSLAKLALKSQCKALFKSNSYGFRLGHKFADATWRIRHKLKYDACWVFDGNIEKCFDKKILKYF